MKRRTYLILLIALNSLSLYCQQDSVIVLDSTYSYYWYSQTSDWTGSFRWIYVFDANGHRIEQIKDIWDPETGKWEGYIRIVKVYDANGNILESIEYHGYPETEWYRVWRYVNTYDSHGKITEINFYDFDTIADDWVTTQRIENTYDADGNRTEEISYEWDSDANDWVYSSKTLSFWSALNNSRMFDGTECAVYPNPFTDYTTVRLSDGRQIRRIDLIDSNGRILKIMDNLNSNAVTVHRDNLQNGTYLLRIYADDTYVKKIIIMQLQ